MSPAALALALAVGAPNATPNGVPNIAPNLPPHDRQPAPGAARDTGGLAGLPLVEVPARGGPPRALAVLVTGDGDWGALARQVAQTLADSGVGVVAVKARAYLSAAPRTPDGVAGDLSRVARTYALRWDPPAAGRSPVPVALVGYSRGADMLPLVAPRLAPDVRARVASVTMLGLATSANLTFHWTDLVRDAARPSDVPVAPELPRLRAALPRARLVCVYGEDEKDSGCRGADPALLVRVPTGGGHHFDRDYPALADVVLAGLRPRD